MGSTGVFDFTPGMSLRVRLYPEESSSIANGAGGDVATENGTDSGRYTITVAETLSGRYHAAIENITTGNIVGRGKALIEDGGTFQIVAAGIDELLGRSTTVVVSATAVSAQAANNAGRLTVVKYTTFRVQITGLGDISDREELHFSFKQDIDDEDGDAILHMTEADDLQTIEGETAEDSSQGTIVVDDEDDGDIALYVHADATGALTETEEGVFYSVKVKRENGDWDELIDFRNADVRADIVQGVDRHT